MKSISSHPFVFFGIGLIFVIFIHMLVSQFDTVDQELNNAYKSYQKGENASTLGERIDAFNESLAIYKSLEAKYAPTYGNGKLYYNIGNSYFQLSEYPLAALYYMRALNLMPRDEKVKINLEITNNKLDVKRVISDSIFDKTFFFHHSLSLPERLQTLFVLSCALFILGSFFIWKPFFGLKILTGVTVFCFILLLGSVFYSQYIAPSYGVILKANQLYQDAGIQYRKVLDQPILPGTKVTVLEVFQNGKWIKIATPDGSVGFIPSESMQII